MERIINVKVSGNHLTKDGKNAGTRGEANVTNLRITFDEGWRVYAKYVTFWDAHGMNPTRRTLTRDLLENIYESTLIYLVPIPYEALSLAGELTFTIDGYTDGKRQIGISNTLVVQDAIITDEVYEPTPDQYTQLMMQYQSIVDGILRAARCRDEAETFAGEAKSSAQIATIAQGLTESLRQQALESAVTAMSVASKLQNIFASCAISNKVEGITVGMAVSGLFPLKFDSWSVNFGDSVLASALGPEDEFVTAPVIFQNEGITVTFYVGTLQIVTELEIINKRGNIQWGILKFKEFAE